MNPLQHQSTYPDSIDDLIGQMESLRRMVGEEVEHGRNVLAGLPPERLFSAENLLHYLALRREDIRPLQDKLTRLGLSSLGRVEPHVMATINAVLHNLYLLNGQKSTVSDFACIQDAFNNGADCLERTLPGCSVSILAIDVPTSLSPCRWKPLMIT